jgi:His/Glu/Gln/Arg/opine family amino acid ABC transporter permease subunit
MLALWEIAYKYRIMLWSGTKITILISILTIILGLVFGTLMAFMKMSRIGPFRWFANTYVEIIRGTPVLVQIAIVFYGLPMMGIRVPQIIIAGVDCERLFSGILALTINTTAYVCEIIRSGIQSVDKGQMEGARAIGFSTPASMILVILPQAVKNILPAMGNEFVTIIKTSSQVSVIGMAELMYAADTIRGISFRPMEPLIIVAVIYFVLTFSISQLLGVLERHLAKSTR